MKKFLRLWICFSLSSLPALCIEKEFASIEAAISSLGDDQYAIREAATLFLWSQGSEVEPELTELLSSKDPELRLRATDILEFLKAGILPDTDPEIKQLAEQYREAVGEQKLEIIRKLTKREAYEQIFSFYDAESDSPDKRNLTREIERIIPKALKSLLSSNSVEKALKLLSMSPITYTNSRRWAAIVSGLENQNEKESHLTGQKLKKEELRSQYNLLAYAFITKDRASAAELLNEKELRRFSAKESLLNKDFEAYSTWSLENAAFQDVDLFLKGRTAIEVGNDLGLKAVVIEIQERSNKGEKARKRAIRLLIALGEKKAALSLRSEEELKDFQNLLVSHSDWKDLFAYLEIPDEREKLVTLLEAKEEEQLASLWKLDEAQNPSNVVECLYLLNEFDLLSESLVRYLGSLKKPDKLIYLDELRRKKFYFLPLLVHQRDPELLTQEELKKLLVTPYPFALYLYDLIEEHHPDLPFNDAIKLILEVGFNQVYEKSQATIIESLVIKGEPKANVNERVQLHYRSLLKQAGYQERLAGFLEKKLEAKPSLEASFDAATQWIYLAEWEKALVRMQEVEEIANERNNSYLKLFLIACYYQAGEDELANKMLQDLELEMLYNPQELFNAVLIFRQCDLPEKALEFLEKALQTIDPTEENGRYWHQFIELALKLYHENGDYEKALAFQKAKTFHLLQKSEIESKYNNLLFVQTTAGELLRNSYQQDLLNLKLAEARDELLMKDVSRIARYMSGSGLLADDLFPFLSKNNRLKELQSIAEQSLQKLESVIQQFPKRTTEKNTFAWLSSRAAYRLEEGEKYIEDALKLEPRNGAYLDTKAEIYFALKKREEALQFSERAWKDSFNSGDPMLRKQYQHFQNDPFPTVIKR